ncbi:hypothetical protein CGZ93_11655 [Enemella dayhoffiae]|uniref:Exo-alpha-sialidase n=1 Tax=Enemella dayhoffiae TaxID=2016507 RepID=A0A255GZ54_9ACTN|nr:hypothetical protein [Enemella dayhoffiae]OYO20869.1 hypothetical protein CGZ93_11655 [Enemella dayhoffiae]
MNRIVSLTLAAATVFLLAGCAPGAVSDATPPTIEHVHGIAADPRGDDLLIATHNGVFTVTGDGKVTGPIGDDDLDAMGFTVVGSTFFASGHPGLSTPAELGSPNLGVIRSDDFGQTWTPVALTGSTDFHVLTAGADGTLYGIPSGSDSLLISTTDGEEWENKATIAAADLLATDAGLYAATENGLMLSTDQGTTFAAVAGAPALYTLAARGDGTLVGVGTDGVLWSQNAAGTWGRGASTTGTVQAFNILTDDRVVLVDDRGIVEITATDTKVLSPAR